ncbi:PglL family O-oligosaccharyltransferase [Citrobacter amalonaticus]|uniref:PglL family O-oligosaccharyltransferase n=1 Tax=Citrobacter amalonaticus TaxID=35703 RepID=UPI00300CFE80
MFKIIIIICCILTSWYIPSSGGAGVRLAYNLLFLLLLGSGLVLSPLFASAQSRIQPNNNWLYIGFLCLCVPWLFYIKDDRGSFILILAFFCWWLTQKWYISRQAKNNVVLLIFFVALAQCVIALIQVFCPQLAMHVYEYDWIRNHGRPYGIFQQVNLLASFLATGIGCGFFLLLRETRKIPVCLYCTGLSALTFTLSIIQSRAGIIGMLTVLAGLWFIARFKNKRKVISVFVLMSLSFTAGAWVVSHTHIMINGEMISMAREFRQSDKARFFILKATLVMIALKPWLGWGYGTYEYAFSRFIMTHPQPEYQFGVITHPHNELLYAWFQGGMIALVGVIFLVIGWIKNVIAEGKHKAASAGYSLLVLPFLVHLNLEYPFYQSFIHLAVFVTLLRLGERDIPAGEIKHAYRKTMLVSLLGVALISYSLLALYTHSQLTHYERAGYIGYPDATPWYFDTQYERAKYDSMVSLLIKFNATHDANLLNEFMSQAQKYSLHHNDRNIWLSMISIAQYQGEPGKAEALTKEYHLLFPQEDAE